MAEQTEIDLSKQDKTIEHLLHLCVNDNTYKSLAIVSLIKENKLDIRHIVDIYYSFKLYDPRNNIWSPNQIVDDFSHELWDNRFEVESRELEYKEMNVKLKFPSLKNVIITRNCGSSFVKRKKKGKQIRKRILSSLGYYKQDKNDPVSIKEKLTTIRNYKPSKNYSPRKKDDKLDDKYRTTKTTRKNIVVI